MSENIRVLIVEDELADAELMVRELRRAGLGESVRRALSQRQLRAERALAIEALRQSEERHRLVSEITADYAYSLDAPSGQPLACAWITEPFTRITGFTAAEINLRG